MAQMEINMPVKKNISSQKKLYSILFLFGSVLVAGYIIFTTPKNPEDLVRVKNSENDTRFDFSNTVSEKIAEALKQENFTDQVFQHYGFQIAAENGNGPQNGSLILPSSEKFEEALKSGLARSIEYTPVRDTDIRVSNDTSAIASQKYLEHVALAGSRARINFEKDFATVLGNFGTKGNTAELDILADRVDALANSFLEITTPTSWKSFHVELINIHRRKAAVLHALAQIDNDPIKAIVALQEFKLISSDEANLSKVLAKKSESIKL